MLIKCRECELQVSDMAEFCPHCGCPVTSRRKKKRKKGIRTSDRMRLPNGFGQISMIKDRNLRNPYRAMVSVGKTDTGRPVCKLLKPQAYFPTYNDAYAALLEYNRNPYDLEPGKTVKDVFEEWSEKYYLKLKNYSSVRAVETAWSYCSSVYNMRIVDLRARHIKACLENGTIMIGGNPKTPSAAMKNKIKSLFNLMLDYAYEYEMVERNYARTFKLNDETIKEIQTVKKEHIPFTNEEIDILWEHVDDKYSVDLVLIHSKIRPLVLKRYNEAKELGSRYLFNYSDQDRHDNSIKLTYNRYTKIFNCIKEEIGLNLNHRPHDGRILSGIKFLILQKKSTLRGRQAGLQRRLKR